jgi:hypothetical protein
VASKTIVRLINRYGEIIFKRGVSLPEAPTSSGCTLLRRSFAAVNRPDNNITGVTSLAVALAAKRAEFLRELVPTASKLAFLINPTIDITQIEVERRVVAPERADTVTSFRELR